MAKVCPPAPPIKFPSETNFGAIFFAPESVFEFPHGLPGFEERRKFLPVQNPRTAPILVLAEYGGAVALLYHSSHLGGSSADRLHITEQDLKVLEFPA
jgi:hypothetical protein